MIKLAACKIIPCLLLMCGFVYAQNAPTKKPKPAKTKQQKAAKPAVVRDTATIVPLDTLNGELDLPEIDPMDTIQIRTSKSGLSSKVKYEARDSMPYDAVNKVFYLYGKAKVVNEDLTLEADFIKIDLGKNLMTAMGTKDTAGNLIGKPVFKQAGQEYRAEVIKYNYNTKKGYLSEFRTQEGEGYIHGQDVAKNEDNEFAIKDAKYTTCNLDHPHFYIAATKIKVIPDKKIITGPADLVIMDVPTPLALPFGIFPIKKGQSSGVIIPTYGNSTDRGYFLRDGGYYFGLGEHLDTRFTGDFYSNTSWAARTGSRYASRYRYAGDIGFNYAYNKFGESVDPGYYTSKDFQLSWNHRSDPKAIPNTTFTANVNLVSNSYLANNSYVPQNMASNQILSSISFNKGFKNGKYNFSTNARVAQNTQTRDVNISFPDFTFTVSSFAPFKSKYKTVSDKWYENITTNYTTSFRNEVNTKDSVLFRSRTTDEFLHFYDTAGRFGMVHSLPVQTSFKLFKFYTLSASVSMNEYWYLQTIRKDTVNGGVVNRTLNGFERAFTYMPRVGLSTRYYGIKNFSGGKISAIRHVVTPTLDFSYAPDYSDPSRGYYKSYTNSSGQEVKYSIFERGIVGGPGSGRQGNIGFSMDNNIEMKVRQGKDTAEKETKIQIFESLRAGGSYNIFADSLNLSKINLSARTKLFKNISVITNANLDPYINTITTTESGFKTVNRINRFYFNDKATLGVITDGSIGVNATFNKELFKRKTSTKSMFEGELKYINELPEDYYDFNVPWSLTVNYQVNYNRYGTLNNSTGTNYSQTINFYGDFNVTSNWKVGYSSGYDIKNKQLSPYTSVDFIRQLHCWEFKLNWIPIGTRQSFLFTINVKSSLLQDLKLTRRRDWFDRRI
jgi:hypothetical protein